MGKIAKKQTRVKTRTHNDSRDGTRFRTSHRAEMLSAIYVTGEKSERSRVARFHREGARTATTVFGGGTPRWRRVARR